MVAADALNTEFVLAHLRCAALRARLVANDIDFIGISLKAGMIDTITAIDWLEQAGALGYVADMEQI